MANATVRDLGRRGAGTRHLGRLPRRTPSARARPPRIAVAFDGGPAAWAALHRAAALARSLHGTVVVLHAEMPAVSSFDTPPGVFRAAERARAQGAALLAAAGGALGADVSWTTELLNGDPGSAIPRRAAELGAAVLVVGNSGRGALARLVGGSVSRAILDRASVPVLVVPAADGPTEGTHGRAARWPSAA